MLTTFVKCWSTTKKEKNGQFKLFTTKHPEAPAVYGQKGAQIELTQSLKAFEEEGINNKFLLLVDLMDRQNQVS